MENIQVFSMTYFNTYRNGIFRIYQPPESEILSNATGYNSHGVARRAFAFQFLTATIRDGRTRGYQMLRATKEDVMKLRHEFDNEEIGLMLMKLRNQQLPEAADTRARALLTLAGEVLLRKSQNRTQAITWLLMLGFGAWSGHSTYLALADVEATWRILGASVGAIFGMAFGNAVMQLAHYYYGTFVLGVD